MAIVTTVKVQAGQSILEGYRRACRRSPPRKRCTTWAPQPRRAPQRHGSIGPAAGPVENQPALPPRRTPLTETLFEQPGGRLVVAAIADVAPIGSMIYTGVRATFMGDPGSDRLSPECGVA